MSSQPTQPPVEVPPPDDYPSSPEPGNQNTEPADAGQVVS